MPFADKGNPSACLLDASRNASRSKPSNSNESMDVEREVKSRLDRCNGMHDLVITLKEDDWTRAST